jgi:L-ascorbate metabolism protein UlaG (beta-lactamase superfamily)
LVLLLLAGALVLVGCGGSSLAEPTNEATAVPTPTPTLTPMASIPDIAIQGTTEQTLIITYIANAGFIIESGETKIAIDAFLTDVMYDNPTMVPQMMATSSPPFDDIDLMLVTHIHYDHYDTNAVLAYLANNPDTALVTTEDVTTQIRMSASDYDGLTDRVTGIPFLEEGRIERTVNGIDLEMMFLPHGPFPNLGFIFEVGGYRLFHVGDLGAETPGRTVDAIEGQGIPDEVFDFVFLGWFFTLPEESIVARAFDTTWLIPMHYPLTTPTFDSERHFPEIQAGFPNAIIFQEEMQRLIVEPAAPEN